MAAFAGSVKGDRKALETLFHTTGGSGWKNNKGWCTDPDLSRWYGVTVNEHGRVEELCLGYNNLRGMAAQPRRCDGNAPIASDFGNHPTWLYMVVADLFSESVSGKLTIYECCLRL